MTPNTLTRCVCGHRAFMHHFNGHLDCAGSNGRGKCAQTSCECKSYKPDKSDVGE